MFFFRWTFGGAVTTEITGRRRRTKLYYDPELPKSVQKKAENQDDSWLVEHYRVMFENARDEQRLRVLELQVQQLISVYNIRSLEAQAHVLAVRIQEIEDEEDILLLH